MKIVYLDNLNNPNLPARSGHSDLIWSMARRMGAKGHSVKVVAPYSRNPFDNSGVEILPFNIRTKRQNGMTQSMVAVQTALRARHQGADIYHATDAFSAGAAVLVGLKPVVFTVSGNIYQRLASGLGIDPVAAVFYRWWSRWAARSQVLLCTSKDMRYWWRKTGAKESSLFEIPLGVEVDNFLYNHHTPRKETGETQLLAIARLAPENNIDLLLKVLAQPAFQDHNYSLRIAGNGVLKSDLEQQAETYHLSRRIQWLGAVKMESLPELYQSADVFVYTRQDGAPPRVVLEAMASGLPVVSFKGSGVEDYIQDQYNGLLADNGDLKKFGQNLITCMQDRHLSQILGANGRLRVKERFDWSVIVKNLENIYLGLLHNN